MSARLARSSWPGSIERPGHSRHFTVRCLCSRPCGNVWVSAVSAEGHWFPLSGSTHQGPGSRSMTVHRHDRGSTGLEESARGSAHDDFVQRRFRTDGPNRVWLTDLTEHPHRGTEAPRLRDQGRVANRIVDGSIQATGTGASPSLLTGTHATSVEAWSGVAGQALPIVADPDLGHRHLEPLRLTLLFNRHRQPIRCWPTGCGHDRITPLKASTPSR
jgi:hypothetical protein